jgi:phage terminase small subunit
MALNEKQRRFVEEYLIDLNATQAATRAGYSRKTAYSQGQRLLSHVEVQAAISAAQEARSKRTQITQDAVLTELAKIGFGNIADFVDVAGESPSIDLQAVPRDKLAALSEITTETVHEHRGRGETAEVRRVKIKMWDKRSALVDIGRHLGMFKDKVELTGKDGGSVAVDHKHSHELDLSGLNVDELETLERILDKAAEPVRGEKSSSAA